MKNLLLVVAAAALLVTGCHSDKGDMMTRLTNMNSDVSGTGWQWQNGNAPDTSSLTNYSSASLNP